jgi:hypothetical protein
MNSLIGDRFLKRFFGNRSHRHSANLTRVALISPEPTAEKPAEQDCPTGEGLPKEEATPENKLKGETTQNQNTHG